jgi:hypothetical protein
MMIPFGSLLWMLSDRGKTAGLEIKRNKQAVLILWATLSSGFRLRRIDNRSHLVGHPKLRISLEKN